MQSRSVCLFGGWWDALPADLVLLLSFGPLGGREFPFVPADTHTHISQLVHLFEGIVTSCSI
jgi:hypothetical protein